MIFMVIIVQFTSVTAVFNFTLITNLPFFPNLLVHVGCRFKKQFHSWNLIHRSFFLFSSSSNPLPLINHKKQPTPQKNPITKTFFMHVPDPQCFSICKYHGPFLKHQRTESGVYHLLVYLDYFPDKSD